MNSSLDGKEEGRVDHEDKKRGGIRFGDLIGATLLSIILGGLAVLGLWLAVPRRFGFLIPVAFVVVIYLAFRCLVAPREGNGD